MAHPKSGSDRSSDSEATSPQKEETSGDRMRVGYILNKDDDTEKLKKERRFVCRECGFAFGMRSNLKRHVMTVHEDRRHFRCSICGAAFGLKQNLLTHVRVKHERSRPFACDVCGVCFGYKQVLQNHRRNIHGL